MKCTLQDLRLKNFQDALKAFLSRTSLVSPYPTASLAGPSLPLHQRSRRSNSLTPPNSCSNTPSPHPDWPPQEEPQTRSSRSLSLPNEHAPLSPQSSTASSGSSTEAHTEDSSWSCGGSHQGLQKRNSFLEENSGMRGEDGLCCWHNYTNHLHLQ